MHMTRTTKILALALTMILALTLTPAGAQTCNEDPTPEQLMFEEMAYVSSLDIPPGIENMLNNEIHAALDDLADGDIDATVEEMEDFIAKTERQSGKQLETADADLLIALAEEIIIVLTQPPAPPAPSCPCQAGFQALIDGTEAIEFCNASRGATWLIYSADSHVEQYKEVIWGGCSVHYSDTSLSFSFATTPEEAIACRDLILQAAADQGVPCV